MFPLNDTEPNRYDRLALMTITLIATNVVVFFIESASLMAGNPVHLLSLFGSTPTQVLSQQGGGGLSAVTSMFLHGGIFHLVTNMWALWVFGRRVEDVCGPIRFLFFYLVCGLFADIFSTLIRPYPDIPSIGASGAIFGVMGAYLMLFPNGRIRTLIILWIIPAFPRLRAAWVILYFLAVQLIPAANAAIWGTTTSSTNNWAHLGGFLGCLSIFLFMRPDAFARFRNREVI
jgi:membrane associated rhomboid family serine protease